MKRTHNNLNTISKTVKLCALIIAVVSLNGCLMTSPYWNQELTSHTALVPLQSWTTQKQYDVKYECAKASHAGLYPFGGPVVWNHIDTVSPQSQSLKDSFGVKVYGAGIKRELPNSCWRLDPANNIWYSAVRAVQLKPGGNVTYQNFDKAGLECLGTEVGKATSWLGWLNKDCVLTYSNSSNTIPYVIFRAPS